VYTQVGIDFVAALSPPKSPFLACEVAIMGDFELASPGFLPQNWGPGGGSPGSDLDSITCVYTAVSRGATVYTQVELDFGSGGSTPEFGIAAASNAVNQSLSSYW
jgi:hypothetical protein